MPTPNSSARPLLRIGAALAAALGAAFAAAPRPALGLAAEAEGPLPSSSTCGVCHNDSRHGSAFSHRGLEESADGCLTCHGDGAAHVAARGAKGTMASLPKGPAEAEAALCLMCHEEETYAAPAHFEPRGKTARCTDCHTLHGGLMPVRPGSPGSVDLRPRAPAPPTPGSGPAAARPFAHGVIEAGWRFTGGEKGRYEQDVGLDDGPRLLALDAVAGLDEADPLAPRAEIRSTGLGDPNASLRVRARSGDDWSLSVTGRRDEHPFLRQNGLHGGETLRKTLNTTLDLRLDRTLRAAFGYDLQDVEGEVDGTLYDNGAVVPVTADTDRRSGEGWASLSGRGRLWHASLRQGWLWETGDDGKDRDRSVPSTPDYYLLDNDSSMTGPRTSGVAGFETRGGTLSVEARGSRTRLQRDVSLEEHRRSVISGNTLDRHASTDGDRDLLLAEVAADAAFAFGDRWALEGGFSRRSLREDGDLSTVTTTDSGSGPTTSVATEEDDLTHLLYEESLALRHTLEGGFTLRGGVEASTEELNDRGTDPRDETVRSRGFFGAAEGKVTPGLTLRGEVHSSHGSGEFTPLTPRDRGRWRAAASWKDAEGFRTGVDWSYTRVEQGESGLRSTGNSLRLWGGLGLPDDFTVDLSYTVRQQTLDVDTRYWSSATLVDGNAESKIRAHLLDLALGVPLSPRLRLFAAANWAADQGSLPLDAWDARIGLRWEISSTLAAKLEVRRRVYDEDGVNTHDYDADILQISLEMRF